MSRRPGPTLATNAFQRPAVRSARQSPRSSYSTRPASAWSRQRSMVGKARSRPVSRQTANAEILSGAPRTANHASWEPAVGGAVVVRAADRQVVIQSARYGQNGDAVENSGRYCATAALYSDAPAAAAIPAWSSGRSPSARSSSRRTDARPRTLLRTIRSATARSRPNASPSHHGRCHSSIQRAGVSRSSTCIASGACSGHASRTRCSNADEIRARSSSGTSFDGKVGAVPLRARTSAEDAARRFPMSIR